MGTFNINNYQRDLFPFAYNILGVVQDAEDVVQDVMINWHNMDTTSVGEPRAYLIRSVVNRAINLKEKNQRQRTNYIGPWLPEPIYTNDPAQAIDCEKTLTYSMLVLLEQLNAKERGVFILRESFNYNYNEIAEVLELSADNCRQLYKRSKSKVGPISVEQHKWQDEMEQVDRLVKALMNADTKTVEQMLSSDVSFTSDSGGKVSAARNIVYGVESVSKFLKAIFTKYIRTDYVITPATINHKPALLYTVNNEVVQCGIFSFEQGKLDRVCYVLNPDKLKKLKTSANLSQSRWSIGL